MSHEVVPLVNNEEVSAEDDLGSEGKYTTKFSNDVNCVTIGLIYSSTDRAAARLRVFFTANYKSRTALSRCWHRVTGLLWCSSDQSNDDRLGM